MTVNLRQLRVFLTVAETGGFTRAAEQLRISQPAITKSIRDLETSLDVALFERLPRGVALTDAGRSLLRYARAAVAELNQATREIEAIKGTASGRLAIGTSPIGAPSLVPRALIGVLEEYPELSVEIREGIFAELGPLLLAGELDLIVTPIPVTVPDYVVYEELWQTQFSIIVRVGHPLTRVEAPTIADLAAYRWIMPPRTVAPRRIFDNIFLSAGIKPPFQGIESSDYLTIRTLLWETDMATMLPRAVVIFELEQGTLTEIDVPTPNHRRAIGALRRVGSETTPQAELFLSRLQEQVRPFAHPEPINN
jgi:DNA-binding transcriptional LysR family regulator